LQIVANKTKNMTEQKFTNTLYTNDNLFILNGMNSNLVDLIYLDPPFNSKRFYSAPIGSKAAGSSFKDMWTWEDVNEAYLEILAEKYPALTEFIASIGVIHSEAMKSYLTYMAQRIIEMHRVLKDTGSLYLHCDTTASHYLKIVLDEIFGKNNFRNEIVWSYQGTADPKTHFKRKHDIILFYSKSKKTFFSDTGSSEIISHFSKSKFTKKDENGYYKEIKHKDGQVYKQYLRQMQRKRDVWEIPIINAMSKERTGYPTQKPLALLQWIILASSKEGDIVLDPFCGCATTCVAAQQLNRKWIGIDIEKHAVNILIERLSDDAGMFKDFINTTIVPQRTDVKREEGSKSIKERLYGKQNGLCNGCGVQFEMRNMEIDHIIPKSKGGGDYYENYQLLCSNCNRKKGDRPMEYLRMKSKTKVGMLEKQIIFGK
jgi:site-specific DNA-methyltransferase (adenine-specific)